MKCKTLSKIVFKNEKIIEKLGAFKKYLNFGILNAFISFR